RTGTASSRSGLNSTLPQVRSDYVFLPDSVRFEVSTNGTTWTTMLNDVEVRSTRAAPFDRGRPWHPSTVDGVAAGGPRNNCLAADAYVKWDWLRREDTCPTRILL